MKALGYRSLGVRFRALGLLVFEVASRGFGLRGFRV